MKYVSRLFCLLAISTSTAIAEEQPSSSNELETIVVTDTREGKAKRTLPESVDVLSKEDIQNIAPSHPSELMNRIPGVHVNNLGGEGHMTMIRQPITTAGVYLFLEDGIPTRPSGLFNHNGLYEVNMPMADSVEVVRGPGSALYGSDAIGGIINTITAAPPEDPAATIDLEHGSYGWRRALVSAGTSYAPDAGISLSANITDTEGFRHDDDFERNSFNLRWDTPAGEDVKIKTIMAYNDIDQSGVSGLNESDYLYNPSVNYYSGDIGRRTVYAFRMSSEVAWQASEDMLFTVTPYYRDNSMDLMPSWMLSYDPVDYTTAFQSYGLLSKFRLLLPSIGGEFITGIDMEKSPSTYKEDQLKITRSGKYYNGYLYTGRVNYDFEATQYSISPYAHLEWQLAERLRASLGVRHDRFEMDYEDKLSPAVQEQKWLRPDDQTNIYEQTSSKLGLIYELAPNHNVYANYREAFRIPTAGQLFRSGRNIDTDLLKPVTSDSTEVGLRGALDIINMNWINYEIALYQMNTHDDIVSYIDGFDRKITNAGETLHEGVEIGLNGNMTPEWGFNIAWTYTEQTYEEFTATCSWPVCMTPKTIDFNGNDIALAPQDVGSVSLSYEPYWLRALRLETELVHIGDYYTDPANTQTYDGYNIFNLRGRYLVTDALEFYGRVENVTDRSYSTYTSNQVGIPDLEYRPGNPRTFYIGARYTFR